MTARRQWSLLANIDGLEFYNYCCPHIEDEVTELWEVQSDANGI